MRASAHVHEVSGDLVVDDLEPGVAGHDDVLALGIERDDVRVVAAGSAP